MSTGTVRLKHSFLFASPGMRRQLDLFLPGPWSEPLPIHVWAIEHAGELMLVDTGEHAAVRDIPFARFDVSTEQELPGVMRAAGLSLDDVSRVFLTHHHGDHVDGVGHVRAPVLIHDEELAFTREAFPTVMRKVLRQPLPPGFSPQTFALDGGPFGAFPRSHALSDDGRIVVVATPGHTPGHVSVICIDDDGRHLFIAGDATDTLEQLRARRFDAVATKPAVQVESIDRILSHTREHPTIYLPSHDPESVARLEGGVTV